MRPIQSLFILFLLIMSGMSSAQAQPYGTSVGLRGPLGNGITFKHFVGEETALEGIAAFRYRGFMFTGLFEKHAQAFDVENFQWYYGAGGHIGFWDGGDYHPWFDTGSHTVIGVDGVIGLEYTIEAIPFNVGVDFKPAINLVGASDDLFWIDAGGVSIRYILDR